MKKVWNILSGDSKRFEQHYQKLYGKSDHGQKIEAVKKKNLRQYGMILVLGIIVLVGIVILENVQTSKGIISEDNQIVAIRRPLAEEGTLKVRAAVTAASKEGTFLRKLTLTIRPEAEEAEEEMLKEELQAEPESYEHKLEEEIKVLVKQLNRSEDEMALWLPEEIPGGIRLTWEEARSSNIPLAALGLLVVCGIVFQNRYRLIQKEEQKAKESIIRELPEFINQLVLLLNAGLVLTAAFSKIVQEIKEGRDTSYFHLQLLRIERNMRETNSPFTEEFRDFARRSGIKELMRLSNIISDNVDKGAGLVEKLQGESELLWFTKKKNAEEKGRLAETKMTFPLMLLLLILIMVTITPALMEM